MALDLQTKLILDQLAAMKMPPPLETLTPEQIRMAILTSNSGEQEAVGKIENRTIPGPGEEIPVRVYYPKESQTSYSGLVFFHGGGWVTGNIDSHDDVCRSLTNLSNCVTISVDYRLAPENKFPAGVENAYASAQYVYEHAKEFQVDPSRIAVGGDSAGGNLAAVVSNLAKERGTIEICCQLLMYPSTGAGVTPPFKSMHENAEGYLLTSALINWFLGHYLNNEEEKQSPLVSPMFYEDFKGLPPTLVITAEFDPLRDEGEAYAKKLAEVGVEVECIRYDGTIHGFVSMSKMIDKGKEALVKSGEWLVEYFNK
ncbi:alpha/beta hydrolase [Bacillus rugosus]|uniref:Alpha/beta hydrolase n=1 Tax=Bacillus rugosus TaxID=2715209 RepID=A0ACD3ZZ99_9BACI|nr:alpha/beta hydrolase [Bacillus rugosus]UPV79200.1 alpha/beta hydrolase [Bacillus rugosus]